MSIDFRSEFEHLRSAERFSGEDEHIGRIKVVRGAFAAASAAFFEEISEGRLSDADAITYAVELNKRGQRLYGEDSDFSPELMTVRKTIGLGEPGDPVIDTDAFQAGVLTEPANVVIGHIPEDVIPRGFVSYSLRKQPEAESSEQRVTPIRKFGMLYIGNKAVQAYFDAFRFLSDEDPARLQAQQRLIERQRARLGRLMLLGAELDPTRLDEQLSQATDLLGDRRLPAIPKHA
jgi:hypothetical protein